jgi:hypothetical protein
MMPYCQECIKSNEDIAADYHRLLDLSQAPRFITGSSIYHRLLDGQPMFGGHQMFRPFEVRVISKPLKIRE